METRDTVVGWGSDVIGRRSVGGREPYIVWRLVADVVSSVVGGYGRRRETGRTVDGAVLGGVGIGNIGPVVGCCTGCAGRRIRCIQEFERRHLSRPGGGN
eukprot:Pompholyxophrys_punicea_v1_NODE_3_length_10569_cov_612.508655.p12 type:complete len:100 gc:universal NODE_3_length_10569_cov_612.508655:2054-2353(+)